VPLRNPYRTGDKVLASRLEDGENHELGTVIDSYELLIGAESKPMVVVEFDDGERKYIAAGPPNVLPAPASAEEPAEGEGEGAAPEADADAGDERAEGAGASAPQGPDATASEGPAAADA
jgi:hypothetical protein